VSIATDFDIRMDRKMKNETVYSDEESDHPPDREWIWSDEKY